MKLTPSEARWLAGQLAYSKAIGRGPITDPDRLRVLAIAVSRAQGLETTPQDGP